MRLASSLPLFLSALFQVRALFLGQRGVPSNYSTCLPSSFFSLVSRYRHSRPYARLTNYFIFPSKTFLFNRSFAILRGYFIIILSQIQLLILILYIYINFHLLQSSNTLFSYRLFFIHHCLQPLFLAYSIHLANTKN
jgi:hypothetical protein